MHEHGPAEVHEDDVVLSDAYEGECVGCEAYTKLDDLGLCEECGAKLDRDMIRERDWERSITAWICPAEKREELREHVIREHGAKLELIAPSKPKRRKSKSRKRKRRNKV